jgi:hypothetical protein
VKKFWVWLGWIVLKVERVGKTGYCLGVEDGFFVAGVAVRMIVVNKRRNALRLLFEVNVFENQCLCCY